MTLLKIKGSKPMLIILAGIATTILCGPLSMLPAIAFSEHTPDARLVFYYPKSQPVWVAPWLYYFSLIMHFMMFIGVGLAVLGMLFSIRRKPAHKSHV